MYSGPTLHYLHKMEREHGVRKCMRSYDEVARAWALQSQSEAKYQSMYFQGPVIYSYGRHFPIARHVRNPGLADAVLMNVGRYSSTTSRHVYTVNRALDRERVRTFDVPGDVLDGWSDNPDICASAHLNALSYFTSAVEEHLIKAKTARSKRLEHFESARCRLQKAQSYASFFGLRKPSASRFAAALEGNTAYVDVMRSISRLDTLVPSVEFLATQSRQQRKSEVSADQLSLLEDAA
jgi:hypothetical protein